MPSPEEAQDDLRRRLAKGLRTHAPALLALLVAVASAWPLAVREELPKGADMGQAHLLVIGMAEGLAEGSPYPRWVDGANRGLGCPCFVFYPPLAYYGAAALHALAGDPLEAVRWTLLLSTLAAALVFYASVLDLLRPWPAALGAALYVSLPYHSVDLYHRSAFAETVAFVWFPLLFRAVRSRSSLGLGLAYGAAILTHMATAFLGAFVVGLYAVVGGLRRARPALLGGLLGIVLAAPYLVPLVQQRALVHEDYVLEAPYGSWLRNMVFVDEVALGFTEAPVKEPVTRSVVWQGALALVALGLARRRPEARRVGVALAGALALQTPLSAPLWERFPEMEGLVFPWRAGILQQTLTATLAGLAATERWATGVVVAASLPALVVSWQLVGHPPYVFDSRWAERSRTMVWPTMIPRGVEDYKAIRQGPEPERKAWLEDTEGRVSTLAWQPHRRVFGVSAPVATRLHVWTFAYPRWRAYVGGRSVEIVPSGRFRHIAVPVPEGEHEVVVRYDALGVPD